MSSCLIILVPGFGNMIWFCNNQYTQHIPRLVSVEERSKSSLRTADRVCFKSLLEAEQSLIKVLESQHRHLFFGGLHHVLRPFFPRSTRWLALQATEKDEKKREGWKRIQGSWLRRRVQSMLIQVLMLQRENTWNVTLCMTLVTQPLHHTGRVKHL